MQLSTKIRQELHHSVAGYCMDIPQQTLPCVIFRFGQRNQGNHKPRPVDAGPTNVPPPARKGPLGLAEPDSSHAVIPSRRALPTAAKL